MLRLTLRYNKLLPQNHLLKSSFGRIGYSYRVHNHFSPVTVPVASFSSGLQQPSNGDDKNAKGKDEKAITTAPKQNIVIRGMKAAYKSTKEVVLNPRATWEWIKEGAHHYWVGSKLLWSEIKITWRILGRVLKGHEMTRRERRQLIRTTTDLFRLIPFAIFVIVPFMELLLPLALKLFPNMLPSTFEDSMKKEESLKKELQMRLAVAKFMQETMQEMANKKSISGETGQAGAAEILDFVDKAYKGEHIPNEQVIRIATLFRDELTLPNMARPQLISMCKYMGLPIYGSDDILRFQLRSKFRAIKEDDRRILWEGIDSLNTIELREACQERGMRSIGVTHFRMKSDLQEWLQLSTTKNIPISLLIMSRAFSLTTSDEPEEVLKSSVSSLDSDTINEVVVASAKVGEEKTIDMQKRKLESLKFQEELIEEEIESKEQPKKDAAAAAAAAVAAASESADKNNNSNDSNKEKHAASSQQAPAGDGPAEQQQQPAVAKAEAKELTLQEIQALSDLARGSSLFREKSELHALQSMLEDILARSHPEKSVAHHAPHQHQHHSDQEINESFTRLRGVLQNMVSKLQVQIESTEKAVGEKFNVLDKDNDGQLSADELKEAIVKLFRRNYTIEEAEKLINELDGNKDGQISLTELLDYIHEKRERLEGSIEKHEEAHLDNATPTPPPAK